MPSKRILIIDDEPDILEVLRCCLTSLAGWQVYCADSGFEGIDLASEVRPDAILLDLMMPSMDGLTVLRHLRDREETRNIPVILISAKIQLLSARRQQQLKVAGAIPKPFHPRSIVCEIQTFLGWDEQPLEA
ncbi:response regulator [Lyngbya sp. CCY1209]|jgi:CheY-like chemotaxis protein|uniref:response regulator n=1 Tax=Lyngbya sp. CCY1209 TaxID=2886103 RepID=UPI002D2114E8|nr:response regulator [Lyngbya sp. CCY1209]MEB3887139.1 response regulator [Lyngbya sp. CCY1209]